MRRSICYTEPNTAFAGDIGTWTFIYTTANSLPKGAKLLFDMQSNGRDIDWQTPSASPKAKSNVIYAHTEDGKPFYPKEVDNPNSYVPFFEFTIQEEVKAGDNIYIIMGAPPKSKKEDSGNACQLFVQRRRSFAIYCCPKPKGKYEDEPSLFTMDVKGNELDQIRLLTPSYVMRNKRFDVTIRFEDAYGNLTSNAPDDTLIELSYDQLRENLNWKLFVPETGFITLPNLYFNEPGIYTLKLTNLENKEEYFSWPIKCFPETQQQLLWGLLHGESERVDSTVSIESCLRHFRDERSLNFYGTSSFENADETPNEIWKNITQNITEFNEEDRFVTFLGQQWSGTNGTEGVRQLIFNKDNKQILRKKDLKSNTLKKIYRLFSEGEMISVPSFTMGKGNEYHFDNFTPEFERVVEIYNAWGSSEYPEKEGNQRPIAHDGKKGVKEAPEGSIREALNKNCRFGFVGGGLDDRGIYSDFYDSDQLQYSPGLTAIICEEFTREGLFKALFNRSCYATSGERIILGFSLSGLSMGQEITTEKKPGLVINRHLSGFIASSGEIEEVEIIRNGEVIATFEPNETKYEFSFDDSDILSDICLKPKVKKDPPFTYYYVRVLLKNGHRAWASPIWVDYVETKETQMIASIAGGNKPAAKKKGKKK